MAPKMSKAAKAAENDPETHALMRLSKLEKGIDGYDEPTGGARIQCRDCGRFYMANKILIDQDDPAHDWRGELMYRCFNCLQEPREFDRAKYEGRDGPDADAHADESMRRGKGSAKGGRHPRHASMAGSSGSDGPHPGLAPTAAGARGPRYVGPRQSCLEQFHKQVDHAWRSKAHADGTNRTRARIANYQAFCKDLEESHPGITKKQIRQRITEISSAVACRVAEAFTGVKSDRAKLKAVQEVMDEWVAEYDRKVEDPTYIPQLRPKFVPIEVTDYLHEIVKGLSEFWICRLKDCGFVGLPTDWVENNGPDDQFLCPDCGRQYLLWVQSGRRAKAQNILVI